MSKMTAYHQIGKFIVWFQNIESEINDFLVLLSKSEDENVRILVNELEYSKRLKTADVMFARFVDHLEIPDSSFKSDFHKMIIELGKLGERRNDIVHSKYTPWTNIHGNAGLIRENSNLRTKKGIREKDEEELLPEAFNSDFERLEKAFKQLQAFREKISEWKYPDV